MDLISNYKHMVLDGAWITELLLLALTWVILCIRKQNVFKYCLYTVGLSCALFVAHMALFFVCTGTALSFPLLWSLVHGVISLFFVMLVAHQQPRNKLLLWCVIYNVVISASVLGGRCSLLVSSVTENSLLIGSARTLCYLLMPVSAAFLRKKDFDDFLPVPNSSLFLLSILLLCEYALCIVDTIYFTSNTDVTIVLIVAFSCTLVTNLISVQVLHRICYDQMSVYNLTTENQFYRAERDIARIAETNLEDLRCIRHDLKNQFSYLTILLEQKRYDDMAVYLQGIKDNMPAQFNIIDCGNMAVNTIVNMELAMFRSKGIAIKYNLVVPPMLPFRDEDVLSILTNMMDNALDECCRLKENGREDVHVQLEINLHQSYLLIHCLNSTDRTDLNRKGKGLQSTKTGNGLHGYGTQIITKLAEKYNGCADFGLEEGFFSARVMLDMTR